mgnify:CR=1 FL=1
MDAQNDVKNESEDLTIIENLLLIILEHGKEVESLESWNGCRVALRRLEVAWLAGKMPVISIAMADYFRSRMGTEKAS